MKTHFSIIAVLLLIAINTFSQVKLERSASTEVKTPAVNVGGVKKTLIQKQSSANEALLTPKDTANAQMAAAVVDIAFNNAYRDWDVFGRYHLQIFLLNENNIEVARWSFNENKPNVTQDLNAANDGYYHFQLPMEIENTKVASSLGTIKKGGSLKFVFDCSFQNIASGAEDYFFINSFTLTLNFRNPSFNTNIWPGNAAERKYTAGSKSSVFTFYWDNPGFGFNQ
jgi:hypothetical protein